MSNKILNLDLSKDPIMPAIVYGRVGDDRLQTVTVNLTRRDEVADLTGYDITFEGTTYNRQTKVFDSNNISSTPEGLKKGTFDYTFPNMAFAVAGKYEQAYFSIVKDGKRDSTAGFEIYVDGNADIDAPEAETIITEYNKLVAELNELQNQAIDEMNRNFTEAQGRISELEVQINDLRNKIDQALTDFENGNFWTKEESFNKEESSANVIYQLIGKEKARITLILDFKDKIVGSVIENPNLAFYGILNGIPTAAVGGNEETQSGYDNLSILDGKYRGGANTGANTVRFSKQVFDILESVKGALGEKFFSDQGAYDDKNKVVLIRSLITRMIYRNYGFGSGPNGQKITTQVYANVSKTWSLTTSNITNEVREMSKEIPKSNFNEFISEDGKTTIISFAEPSDNITASAAYLDYSRLEIEIELSANEYFKSVMAANHRENLATQEEAEAETDNSKIMTPLRTKQQIDKRMETLPQYLSVVVGDWVALALNSGFIAADSTVPQYRITTYKTGDVVKKLVEFRGAVTLTSGTISSTFNTISAATIASELRPAQKAMASCSTNELSVVGRVHVAESGNIMIGQNSGQTVNYLYLNNLRYWLD